MIIKRVVKDDLMNLATLRHELWPKYDMEHLLKDSHENFLKDEEYPAFLAIDEDGSICGFIECSIHVEAPGCNTNKIGYIEGWYVRKAWQKRGVGRLLVEAAEEWARSKGIIEMASDTNEVYPASPSAHKSLGYIETDKPLHYKKELK